MKVETVWVCLLCVCEKNKAKKKRKQQQQSKHQTKKIETRICVVVIDNRKKD